MKIEERLKLCALRVSVRNFFIWYQASPHLASLHLASGI